MCFTTERFHLRYMSRHVRTLRTAARRIAAGHAKNQTSMPSFEGIAGHEAHMDRIASRYWQQQLAAKAETALYEHTLHMNHILQDVAAIPEILDAIPVDELEEKEVNVLALDRALRDARKATEEQMRLTEYVRDCLIDMQHQKPALLSPFPLQAFHEECSALTESERRHQLAEIQRQIRKGELQLKAEEDALRAKFVDIMGEEWVRKLANMSPAISSSAVEMPEVDDEAADFQPQWSSVRASDEKDSAPGVSWGDMDVSAELSDISGAQDEGPLFRESTKADEEGLDIDQPQWKSS